jgi:hypothetical protein
VTTSNRSWVGARWLLLPLFAVVLIFLNGASTRKEPPRTRGLKIPKGRPWYERMTADGVLRIALFWGWDHPRETIEAVFPAFETLNGKYIYHLGRRVRLELGMITQIHREPKELFRQALEDPTIDVVIYSGHARFGGGMAFADRDDIFMSGNGKMIEDRHSVPYRYYRATPDDLQATNFPPTYRIIFLNCCDSDGHFRESWKTRLRECGSMTDLMTVEFPVYNLYDNRRILNFIKDLLSFADWKTIKASYDSEVHRRKNHLVVEPVFIPEELGAVATD